MRFPEQVRRYIEVFGRAAIHFIVFDDLVADAPGVYRSALEFLGVDPGPTVEPGVYNAGRTVRSNLLQRALFAPPSQLRGVFGRLRRIGPLHRLRDALVSSNSRPAPRPRMDPALRARLADEFAPQVAELGALIGRDLSAWSAA